MMRMRLQLACFLLPGLMVSALLSRPPWTYRGYQKFPALFFGAQNDTNLTFQPLEPEDNLEQITRFQLTGYGWQHAIGVMREEKSLHAVARQTKAYAQRVGREVITFVYRDAQCADKEYELAAILLNDTTGAKDHWWLRQNGTICERYGQFPHSRQFNWTVPEVVDYYVNTMMAEVAREDAVDVVFFDETDWTFHHYPWGQFENCPGLEQTAFPTDAAWAAYRDAKAALLGRVVATLNAAGKVPLFSQSGGTTANTLAKCPNRDGHWAEQDFLAAMRASHGSAPGAFPGYMRFYESWMGFGETDVDCWENWLNNTLWEAQQGLPFTIRWDMGMFGGSDAWLEFGMAAFLMVQADYCYFGAAANWYDRDWLPFRKQYEWQVGKPMGVAVRTAPYRWQRSFEKCTVSVDLMQRSANFSTCGF